MKNIALILSLSLLLFSCGGVDKTDAFFESTHLVEQQVNEFGNLKHIKFDYDDYKYSEIDENTYQIESSFTGMDENGFEVKMYYNVKMVYDPETEKWDGLGLSYDE